MWHFFVSVFTINCFVVVVCSIDSKPSERNTSEGCFEYLLREDCLKEASAMASKCRLIHGHFYQPSEAKKCDEFEQNLNSQCGAKCAKASCLDCFEKVEIAVKSCKQFANKLNCNQTVPAKECNEMEASMVKYCTREKCDVCKDSYCRNGGKCAGATSAVCACPRGYGGAFCHKSLCAERPCLNGGSCIGVNKCKCLHAFGGEQCARKRLGTKESPAPNAQAILDAGDSLGSGLYWIQPLGESSPAQTYCDMNFDGGAWMLASYGYVHTTGLNSNNHGIPNLNNLFGYNWRPNQRESSNGVINLPEGAVKMAKNARYMIMAAGKNPITGGIDSYSHVYRIYLKNNPYEITFKNHNRYNGANSGMHVTDFLVEALKGESGTYLRFALAEALGVTWGDSYPTGYGFYDKTVPFSSFSKGPFFPSVLSGSGRSPCSGCTPTNYEPDVVGGSPHYTHHGWYTANGWDKTGQTSIWFK